MITTTYDSFPVAQQCLAEFISTGSILSSVVGHYYKSIVKIRLLQQIMMN
nr:hypothetical protein [Legionella sainthelensi]